MGTGENLEGLRKILDFTRLASLLILIMHGYLVGYPFFARLGWTHEWVDKLMELVVNTGLFDGKIKSLFFFISPVAYFLAWRKGKEVSEVETKLDFSRISRWAVGLFFS